MVEQVLRVVAELALRIKRQACLKRGGGALVQRTRIRLYAPCTTALKLVRREFAAPAQRVPQAGIVRSRADRAFQQRDAFGVTPPSRHQQVRQVFERLREVRIKRDRRARQFDAASRVSRSVCVERFLEQSARVVRSQFAPSIIDNVSASVKTRNELVRTLPWLLTASETRVIVWSSGASARMT